MLKNKFSVSLLLLILSKMDLRDMLTIIAIGLGPVTAMIISLIVNRIKESRKQKTDLFLTLLSQRKKIPMTEKFVDALNVIDVVFRGEKEIIDAKNKLLECQNAAPFNPTNYNKRVLDLLDSMSKKLGYKEIKQTDHDSPFVILTADEKSMTS